MSDTPGCYLVFDDFAKIAKELLPAADRIVRATAFKIEAGAKARVPVDTGMLKNSIYTATSRGVGTDASGVAAYTAGYKTLHERTGSRVKGARRIARRSVFPPLATPPPGTAYVAVGAEYGAYVEYGTRHRPAKPYLTPAVEAQRAPFLAGLQQLVEQSR